MEQPFALFFLFIPIHLIFSDLLLYEFSKLQQICRPLFRNIAHKHPDFSLFLLILYLPRLQFPLLINTLLLNYIHILHLLLQTIQRHFLLIFLQLQLLFQSLSISPFIFQILILLLKFLHHIVLQKLYPFYQHPIQPIIFLLLFNHQITSI